MGRLPRLRRSHLLVLLTLVVVGYFLFSGAASTLRSGRVGDEQARLEAEVAQLETRRQQLEELRRYLRTDAYIEWAARQELGLVKPGEVGVVIISPQRDPDPPLGPWWQRLLP